MKIKTLDGSSVLCEDPGCGKPAVYLFSQTYPVVAFSVYCDAHGLRFAEPLRLTLPQTRMTGGRTAEAVA